MDVNQKRNNLRDIIKKNFKKVSFTEELPEKQNTFKNGSNLENETEDIKQVIDLRQNLQNIYKKSNLKHSEKKKNVIKNDEDEDENNINNDEDEDENNIKKLNKKQYPPKELHKIINIKKNLQNNYRKTILNDKYRSEEKVKHYEPILKALSNVESSVNNVKDVAIKTDNDIQKLNVPYYQPRNPELQRLISSEETFVTPKHSRQNSTTNSPLPKNVITLGPIASKYLSSLKDNNCFGINYNTKLDVHMIGKNKIDFENDDIILNGKKYKGTTGLWRLLTHVDPTKPEFYTDDDYNNYKNILIETDSIYQNNDISTGRAKSSGGAKYIAMISKIWREINEKKKIKENKSSTPTLKKNTEGEGLYRYTNNPIEYVYINNVKQLTDRLQFLAAEERAGNNIFHNEKLGILHLCKKSMEQIIDTPKGIEYLLQYVINLPKETAHNDIEKNIKKIHNISAEERAGNNNYHEEKLKILNECIKKMENIIDIPEKGAYYLFSYVSCLPKKIITGSGIVNYLLNCSNLPEMHWPGYNYLGPGTKLEKNKNLKTN